MRTTTSGRAGHHVEAIPWHGRRRRADGGRPRAAADEWTAPAAPASAAHPATAAPAAPWDADDRDGDDWDGPWDAEWDEEWAQADAAAEARARDDPLLDDVDELDGFDDVRVAPDGEAPGGPARESRWWRRSGGERSGDDRPLDADERTRRALLGADRGPRWRIGVGAAVVLVLVALAGSVLVTALRPGAGETVAPVADATGEGTASAAPPAPSGTPPAEATALLVHVAGAVVAPGVYELPAGARVQDALNAAGGPAEGADPQALNLARTLVDGEQVVVPLVGQAPVPAPPPDAAGGDGASGGSSGGLVNLNTATAADLDELPGVGPAIAQRIIDYRDEHGGFASVDELQQVSGIGDATFAELEPLVTV